MLCRRYLGPNRLRWTNTTGQQDQQKKNQLESSITKSTDELESFKNNLTGAESKLKQKRDEVAEYTEKAYNVKNIISISNERINSLLANTDRYTKELDELKKYPPIGEPLLKDQRKGYIQKIDIFTKTVTCDFEDDTREFIPFEEIEDYLSAAQKKGLKKLANVLQDIVHDDVHDLKKIEDK